MYGGDGNEGAGYISGLVDEGEDPSVGISDAPGTRSGQEGGVKGTGIVGKWVEVVTRPGRRAGRVVYGK